MRDGVLRQEGALFLVLRVWGQFSPTDLLPGVGVSPKRGHLPASGNFPISLGGKTDPYLTVLHFSRECPLPLMGAGDQDREGGFVLLTSADSLIKPSSRQGQRGQAFFNRAPAGHHRGASPATTALVMSYPGPHSGDINKGE